MTFAKAENLVNAICGPLLNHDHFAGLWAHFFLISWIKQLPVPPVAWTAFRISAPVSASTEIVAFYSAFILFDVFIVCNVFGDVLFWLVKEIK